MDTITVARTLDFKGLSCPLPIVKTAKAMREAKPGDVLEVLATDPGSVPDFTAWAKTTGNTLVEHSVADGIYRFILRKTPQPLRAGDPPYGAGGAQKKEA